MKISIRLLVILISAVTVFSGILQVVRPEFVLGVIGAETTDTAAHFFAIIGMFMALFGAMMLHAVYSSYPNQAAILYASLQKLGAALAVGLGVISGIFSFMAIGVAVFDLFSGLLFLYYLQSQKVYEVY